MSDYRSPFADWHHKASVRAMAPSPWLIGEPGAWMPDEPGSVLSHPALQGPHRNRVAAGLLLANLSFTVQLENQLISGVARDIAARALQASYPDAVVADALRVQCDEAYHALLAQELIGQVTAMASANATRRAHRFLVHVEQAAASTVGAAPALVSFCAAVVAETLITKTLRDDWLDGGLQQDLRAFLHHHYLDETRHSAYFTRLLELVWPQWPSDVRLALQPLWPGFIDAFLAADEDITRDVLEDAGVPPIEARRVIADCSSPEGVLKRRKASTLQTMHALRRAGALAGPEPAWSLLPEEAA